MVRCAMLEKPGRGPRVVKHRTSNRRKSCTTRCWGIRHSTTRAWSPRLFFRRHLLKNLDLPTRHLEGPEPFDRGRVGIGRERGVDQRLDVALRDQLGHLAIELDAGLVVEQ